ncbi:MAG: ribosome assembly factor SBDS [Candidatus Micrarchaeota archaeon]|nr:ribosome assembly factor SBDS [Candidatus Micrarchaeota archaeon]
MSVPVDKAVVARLVRQGERFEVLVDPAVVSKKDLTDFLAIPDVFHDARKGERVPRETLKKVFGTDVPEEVARIIVKEGEIQLTSEQRREMMEKTRLRIATIISRECINPQTGTPHPPERILNAMEQAGVRVSIEKSPEEQVEEVLESIKRIIPIRIEKLKIEISCSPEAGARLSGVIRNFGKVLKEEWSNVYLCRIEIPAGIQEEVYSKINSLTKGEGNVKIIEG